MALPETLDDLAPAPYNPRRISAEAATGLGVSMSRFGDLSGIVWNEQTGHLVAGHQRLAELRKMGATFDDGAVVANGLRFQVRVVSLTLEEEQAANLAANNPAIAGEFTDDVAGILAAVQEADAALYEALRLGELEPELVVPVDLTAPVLNQDEGDKTKCPKCGFVW
jgi:ParB-like chromosome segregation protein Spo0J